MKIASGDVTKSIYFAWTPGLAVGTFTVQLSRNGGAAVAMSTVTVAEVAGGLYALLVNQETTATPPNLNEELAIVISHPDEPGESIHRTVTIANDEALVKGAMIAAGLSNGTAHAAARHVTKVAASPVPTSTVFTLQLSIADGVLNGKTVIVMDANNAIRGEAIVTSVVDDVVTLATPIVGIAVDDGLVFLRHDKNSYGLSQQAIAGVEAALLDDGDSQAFKQAILDKINADLDVPALELAAIADAVKAKIDADIGSSLQTRLAAIDAAASQTYARLGPPAGASVSADIADTKASADAAGTAVGNLNDLDQADIRTAVGLAAANLDAQLDNLTVSLPEDIGAELASIIERIKRLQKALHVNSE